MYEYLDSVALLTESVDRNFATQFDQSTDWVALLTESVDRNTISNCG